MVEARRHELVQGEGLGGGHDLEAQLLRRRVQGEGEVEVRVVLRHLPDGGHDADGGDGHVVVGEPEAPHVHHGPHGADHGRVVLQGLPHACVVVVVGWRYRTVRARLSIHSYVCNPINALAEQNKYHPPTYPHIHPPTHTHLPTHTRARTHARTHEDDVADLGDAVGVVELLHDLPAHQIALDAHRPCRAEGAGHLAPDLCGMGCVDKHGLA